MDALHTRFRATLSMWPHSENWDYTKELMERIDYEMKGLEMAHDREDLALARMTRLVLAAIINGARPPTEANLIRAVEGADRLVAIAEKL